MAARSGRIGRGLPVMFETERLRLRVLEEEDFAAFAACGTTRS
jgi:hypothetical protein